MLQNQPLRLVKFFGIFAFFLSAAFSFALAQEADCNASFDHKNLENDNNSADSIIASGETSIIDSPHVPLCLRQAIVDEAIANGADLDFDIPALNDYLDTLAQTGDLTEDELAGVQDMAPEKSQELPIVVLLNQVNGDLDKTRRAYNAIKEAADAASGP